MDIYELRGLHSLLIMAIFIGIIWWAFSAHRKKANDEAAQLPFSEDDDEVAKRTLEQEKTEKKQ
ncbi:cbb3-type cytochrome c oxidase subunit 3 [Marinobacter sp.]|uniref:cbb3-type cytochrome oxidase subunit 3 n=1 Tax=Marinobacter sp. TaxID=50741 RepID=UPI0019EDC159|nr:cbb3-type cytochrome c oxidase subunit 3 [Marinobacter sp.]MBE0484575.1 cbb3-type cytochrome c oxidase subunit 3 [Marinobacter sp.]